MTEEDGRSGAIKVGDDLGHVARRHGTSATGRTGDMGRYSESFFFQAEDGIRDGRVTGVQTCALPISWASLIDLKPSRSMNSSATFLPSRPAAISACSRRSIATRKVDAPLTGSWVAIRRIKIGRASWRERGESREVDAALHKQQMHRCT